jgi:hypothetical protein
MDLLIYEKNGRYEKKNVLGKCVLHSNYLAWYFNYNKIKLFVHSLFY